MDKVPFWTARDLERKLALFKEYYNRERTHDSLGGMTPAARAENITRPPLDLARIAGDRTAAAVSAAGTGLIRNSPQTGTVLRALSKRVQRHDR